MKVLHVIPDISKSHGGPSRSCQGLVKTQCEAGVDAWIYTTGPSDRPWISDEAKCVNASEKSFETVLGELKPDLVHIHSIWDLALHRAAVSCRKTGVPYVIAPRGMLEPWSLKQGWLKKRIARFLYQDRDLRCAAALHATAASEEEQFRKLGFSQKVIVSPNGVNLPEKKVEEIGACGETRRALFVSRMHPKKGVMELVEAWARVKPDGWICELVYTKSGAEELAYEQMVMARVKELGLNDQFIFTGPLDDDKKWEAYARAHLFVLPTYSENFGIVIAEALWANVPVITTKGTPWKDLEDHDCGWWIDTGVEALTDCLRSTLNTQSSTLVQMGKSGHSLVEAKYTWKAVVGAMKSGYEKILEDSHE